MEDGKKKLEAKLQDLDEQVKTFRTQCENKIREEQTKAAKQHQELTRELEQRDHDLLRTRNRLAENGRTIGIMETERVKLSSELRESRFQKESLQSKVKDLQYQLEKLQSLNSSKCDSSKEIEDKLNAKFSEMERRCKDQDRILVEHVNRIEGLQKALILARQVQKQTTDDKRKLDEDLTKKEYEVKRLSAELDGTRVALTRLTSEHSACACRIAELQKVLNSFKLGNNNSSGSLNEKVTEQKHAIAELRKQVCQLGAKLESSRLERNDQESRAIEAEAAVERWQETSESLKNEIVRLSKENNREVNDLQVKVTQLESQLQRVTERESKLKLQIDQGLSKDITSEKQLDIIRSENCHLRNELSEARRQMDNLAAERASLFEQVAEISHLRFELEETKRKMEDSSTEAKQLKKVLVDDLKVLICLIVLNLLVADRSWKSQKICHSK